MFNLNVKFLSAQALLLVKKKKREKKGRRKEADVCFFSRMCTHAVLLRPLQAVGG